MSTGVKYLLVIAGPTAVGKSALSLRLAQALGTDIISTDSRQLYKELNIGTAKPTTKELSLVKHHFVDHLSIDEPYTVSQFETESLQRLDELYQDTNVAIACGGTGLYIQALTKGLDEIPDIDSKAKLKYEHMYDEYGLKVLQELLYKLDQEYYQRVDTYNHRRLIRALSVIDSTGKPFSSFLNKSPKNRPFQVVGILLEEDREILYERINLRVDKMLAAGLENEVRGLQEFKEHQALQTVGYQEWFPYFQGERPLAEVIRLVKRNSRRYAKRQMTWFRKYGAWTTFRSGQLTEMQTFLSQQLGYSVKI